eukprot:GHRR01001435.1.p1 GENE.GHRR01001435.1~~GHRR01001435.1.p1  ORF type:complete len:172 (+),score=46.13 GHRR01001435.1:174-689(+)
MVEFTDDRFDASKAPYPKLWFHIAQKGLQGGAVIGTIGAVPALGLWQKYLRNQPVNPLKLLEGAGYTTLGALGLTVLVGALKTMQLDRAGVEDRVYRLHYNKGQNRTDAFAQAGALVGLAAAAYFLRGRSDVKALQYVGSASLGTAGGVLLHVLTRPVDNTPNKMLHELRH